MSECDLFGDRIFTEAISKGKVIRASLNPIVTVVLMKHGEIWKDTIHKEEDM